MSTYAIGDVQGCLSELKALMRGIKYKPAHDTLWFVGDLINRGPDSLGTLRFIKSLDPAPIVVLGNHDLHLLAIAHGQSSPTKSDRLQEILKAKDCDILCEWLLQQPLLHYDPNYNVFMVHAGFSPFWKMNEVAELASEVESVLRSSQSSEFFSHMYGNEPVMWAPELKGWDRLRYITNCLTRLRFCYPNGALCLTKDGNPSQEKGLIPWYCRLHPSFHFASVEIIFGHWAALIGQTNHVRIHAIDTGCVWGYALTCLRLEDRKRFSVPAGTTE